MDRGECSDAVRNLRRKLPMIPPEWMILKEVENSGAAFQNSEEKSQDILNGEATIYGYRRSIWKSVNYFFLNLICFGVPMLLGKWRPKLSVIFTHCPCSLNKAYKILIKDCSNDFFSCDVICRDLPKDEGQNKEGSIRYFEFHHERHIWNWQSGKFQHVEGLENVTCDDVLYNFKGLTEPHRLKMSYIFGKNEIDVEVKSYWKLLIEEILHPFYIFQIFSVILWSFDDYYYYASCVIIVSGVSVIFTLTETMKQRITLRDIARGGGNVDVSVMKLHEPEKLISSQDLVPGDVLLVPPEGLIMPCDAVVICGSAIVNESMLTGESLPITKSCLTSSSKIFDYASNKHSVLYAGTNVVQTRYYKGKKISCVVIKTGYSTMKGSLIKSILFPKDIGFQFYVDTMKFIAVLSILALFGMAYCIYIYIQRNVDWKIVVVRALDIITIVIPPALPAAMTIGTAYAQSRLKKKLIFCTSPTKINIGGKLQLCAFDKTGTLTEEGLDLWCVVSCSDSGKKFQEPSHATHLKISDPLLLTMASCHSLTRIKGKLTGDPLDLKMFEATKWELEEPFSDGNAGFFDSLVPTVVKKDGVQLGIIRTFNFSSSLQRMSVVTRVLNSPSMIMYCKGSPEKIRSLCVSVPEDFDRRLDSFAIRGFRVIAMAWKTIEGISCNQLQRINRADIETELNFSGFLVMQNRLKEATVPVIEELRAACLRSLMVTGDNILTALSVARECGIIPSSDEVIVVSVKNEHELEFKLAAHHLDGRTSSYDNVSLSNEKKNSRWKKGKKIDHGCATDTEALETECLLQQSSFSESDSSVMLSHVALDMDSLVPINNSVPIGMSGEAYMRNQYHFAMNGNTWNWLYTHAPPEIRDRILIKSALFARISPEGKMQIVKSLQDMGYYVSFIGDGANDCSALKAAHVGVSLSDAEASVAAPFTSKVADISCVPNLIREGRCALVTSFGLFKYMALYSLVQFISILILYSYSTTLADAQFLYIDLGITSTIAVFMGRTYPNSKLSAMSPSSSLVSVRNLFSIFAHIIATGAFQLGAITYLKMQPWYTPVSITSDSDPVYKTWETTTLFSVSSFQYLILAFVFSKGPPFRKPFHSNHSLVIAHITLVVFTLVLTVFPYGYLGTFFELMENSNETLRYRLFLALLAFFNLIVAIAIEEILAESRFIKKFWEKCFKKTEKHSYQRILRSLEETPLWPQIT